MEIILKVDGMSCAHCENAVRTAVMAVRGVKSVEVSLEKKTVTVTAGEDASPDAVRDAIVGEGYDVTGTLL